MQAWRTQVLCQDSSMTGSPTGVPGQEPRDCSPANSSATGRWPVICRTSVHSPEAHVSDAVTPKGSDPQRLPNLEGYGGV
jgi:hypothetical protein